MIKVEGLTKYFGPRPAVEGVSFSLSPGEAAGFLGPNGAGKTTTMNLMTGCLVPDAGTVTVEGIDLAAHPGKAKRHIGYLPEQPPLYQDMTVEEYLTFAAALKRIPAAQRSAQIDKALGDAAVSGVRGRLIANLSKGYKQRVGLAQALLGEPEILILDEPTVGLDPAQIVEIRQLIAALARDRTVLLSSHILAEVQAVCGRILLLDGGRLVADSSTEALRGKVGSGALELVVPREHGAALREVLRHVPGLSAMTTQLGEAVYTARFQFEGELPGRAAISQALSAAGIPILELKSRQDSLEDVFLALTGAQKEAKA